MSTLPAEFEELRVGVERLRTLLENLVVRGLRACGPDELVQIKSHSDHLDKAGAGHVAAVLLELHGHIEKDERTSAGTLLRAQTSVRLLERLLTLKVAAGRYNQALARMHQEGGSEDSDADDMEE